MTDTVILLLSITVLLLSISVKKLQHDVGRLKLIEAWRIAQEERGSRHDDSKGERSL